MKLQGKTAIVVGGSGGIGGSSALAMAREGADVTITYKTSIERAREIAKQVNDLGRRCLIVQLDLTDRNSMKATVQKTLETFGKIDVLACVVLDPSHRFFRFVDMPEENLEFTVNYLFRGHIYLCKEVVPHMIQQKYGKIVIVTSDSGKVGTAGETISSACHGGLNSFCKSLARELARFNINVNAVGPGPTDTPTFARWMSGGSNVQKMTDRMIQAVPFKRLGKPEEVGEVITFLASDAASWITGQVISVSGGLTMC